MLPREDYLFCWVLKKSWSWDPTAYLWGEITAHKTQGFITVICFVKTSPLCLYVTVFITQTFHLVTMEISLLTLPRVFCKLHIFIKLELGKEFDDWCLVLWRMVGLTKIWCGVGICKHLVQYYWGGGAFFSSRNLQGCLYEAAQSDLVTGAAVHMHYLLEVGKIILCVGRNHICWWIDN